GARRVGAPERFGPVGGLPYRSQLVRRQGVRQDQITVGFKEKTLFCGQNGGRHSVYSFVGKSSLYHCTPNRWFQKNPATRRRILLRQNGGKERWKCRTFGCICGIFR